MKTLKEYLELCKEKQGLKKDIELANYLGIGRASMSIMLKNGGASQETAERLSKGTGIELEEIWLAILYQREQNPKFKKVLEKISKMSGIAASVLVISFLMNLNIVYLDKNDQEYTLCEHFIYMHKSG